MKELQEALQSKSVHERAAAEILLKTDQTWYWEMYFHPVRKFHFDFACPALKVAIEIHGGVWTRGRHVRPAGFIRDCEKQRIAVCDGWRLLPYVPMAGWLDAMVTDLHCASIKLL